MGMAQNVAKSMATRMALASSLAIGATIAVGGSVIAGAQTYYETALWNPVFMPGAGLFAMTGAVPLIGDWLTAYYRNQINQQLLQQFMIMMGTQASANALVMNAALGPASQFTKQVLTQSSALAMGTTAPAESMAARVPGVKAIMVGSMLQTEQTATEAAGTIYQLARLVMPEIMYQTPASRIPVVLKDRSLPFKYEVEHMHHAPPQGMGPGGMPVTERTEFTTYFSPRISVTALPALLQGAVSLDMAQLQAVRQAVIQVSTAEAILNATQGLPEKRKKALLDELNNFQRTGMVGSPELQNLITKTTELIESYTQQTERATRVVGAAFAYGIEKPTAVAEDLFSFFQTAIKNLRTTGEKIHQQALKDPTKRAELLAESDAYEQAARDISRMLAVEGFSVLPTILGPLFSPFAPFAGAIGGLAKGMAAAPGLGIDFFQRYASWVLDRHETFAARVLGGIKSTADVYTGILSQFGLGASQQEGLKQQLREAIATLGVTQWVMPQIAPVLQVLGAATGLGAAIGTLPMGYRAMEAKTLQQLTQPAVQEMQLIGQLADLYSGIPEMQRAIARTGLVQYLGSVLPDIRAAYAGSIRAGFRGAELEMMKMQAYGAAVPVGASLIGAEDAVVRARRMAAFKRTSLELGVSAIERQLAALEPLAEAAPGDTAVQAVVANLRGELRYASEQRDSYIKWGQKADIYSAYMTYTTPMLVTPVATAEAMAARGRYKQLALGGMPEELWRRAGYFTDIYGAQRTRQMIGVREGVFSPGDAAFAELEAAQYQARMGSLSAIVEGFEGIDLPPAGRTARTVLAGMYQRARLYPVAAVNPAVAQISLAMLSQQRLRYIEQQMEMLPKWRAQIIEKYRAMGHDEATATRMADNDLAMVMPDIERVHQQAMTEVLQWVAPLLWDWAQAQPLLAAGAPARARLLRPSPEGFAEYTWAKYGIPTVGMGMTSAEVTELARSLPYNFVRGFTQLPQNLLSALSTEGGIVVEQLRAMVNYLARITDIMEGRTQDPAAPVTLFPAPRPLMDNLANQQRQR